MLNLAIECSGVAGSVALYASQKLIVHRKLPPDLGSVQTLAATIDSILTQYVTAGPRRVELVSVTCGPGSFTGLRVGLATAQMLAFAWRIPVAPVDTLAAIAWGVVQDHPLTIPLSAQLGPTILVPVLNAFRKQVFVSAWLLSGQPARLGQGSGPDERNSPPRPINSAPFPAEPQLTEVAPAQVLDAAAWQAQPWEALARSDRGWPVGLPVGLPDLSPAQVLVCGPGLRVYPPIFASTVTVAEPQLWEPTARAVAEVGWHVYQRGGAVSADKLRPNYVRASAAEEQGQ